MQEDGRLSSALLTILLSKSETSRLRLFLWRTMLLVAAIAALIISTTPGQARNWYSPNLEVEACQNTRTIPFAQLHTPLALKLFEVRLGTFIAAKVKKTEAGEVRVVEVDYYDHGVQTQTYFFTDKSDCDGFMTFLKKDIGSSEDLR